MRISGRILAVVVFMLFIPPLLHAAEIAPAGEQPRTDTEFLAHLARSGNVEAQSLLGEHYYHRRQYAEALPWLQMAARRGDVEAQRRLADMYEFGRGVPRNTAEATNWLRRATEQGDPLAVYKEGFSYATSAGVP